MATQIRVPEWARNDKTKLLKFLCHYAALQCSGDNNIKAWSGRCGVTDRAVHVSINRGHFTAKTAIELVSTLPAGVLHAYWLIDPTKFLGLEVLTHGD